MPVFRSALVTHYSVSGYRVRVVPVIQSASANSRRREELRLVGILGRCGHHTGSGGVRAVFARGVSEWNREKVAEGFRGSPLAGGRCGLIVGRIAKSRSSPSRRRGGGPAACPAYQRRASPGETLSNSSAICTALVAAPCGGCR